MTANKVSSLKDLQKLVKISGDAVVVVLVVWPVEKLGDVPGMYYLLSNMVAENQWIVKGASELKPLVPVAVTVQKASKIICKLMPFYDPEVDVIIPDLSKDTSTSKIRGLADTLKKKGEALQGFDFKDTRWLGDDLVELANGIKDGRQCRSLVHHNLVRSKSYCRETYNMITFLDDPDDK